VLRQGLRLCSEVVQVGAVEWWVVSVRAVLV
jgi:hypothetical protein